MTKKTKTPSVSMRVRYVSTAGQKIVAVEPKGDTVTIGNESWKVTRNHLEPKGGKFDCSVVSGQSEAMPVWKRDPLGSEEYDSGLHNNLLEQFNKVSGRQNQTKVSWINMGLSVLVMLLLGVNMMTTGSAIDEVKDAVVIHDRNEQEDYRDDTTTYAPPAGHQQGQQPTGGG